jgi:hypothetical protein
MTAQADKYQDLLAKLGACTEARHEADGKGLAEVWSTCQRGNWLLWLTARMIGKPGWPTHQQVVLAACACAETALKFVPKGEDRPRKAIETARRWATGKATLVEVRAADAAAADATYDAADATYAAADATYAAAAADDATYAASAARTKERQEQADFIRTMIPFESLGF